MSTTTWTRHETTRRATRSAWLGTVALATLALAAPGATAEQPPLQLRPADGAVQIEWPAQPGADGYRVVRDGTVIAELAGDTTTYSDQDIVNGVLHDYRVDVIDSGAVQSLTAAVTTAAVDLTPPAAVDPVSVETHVADHGIALRVGASAALADDAAEYRFYVDGELAGVHVNGWANGWADADFGVGLIDDLLRFVEVEVIDRAGNASLRRGFQLTPLDLDLPAMPLRLRASACGDGAVTLAWDVLDGAGGDAGVSFGIYREDELIATTSSTTHRVSGLAAGTPTDFHVVALDATGNPSPQSYTMTVTSLSSTISSRNRTLSCSIAIPDAAEIPPQPFLQRFGYDGRPEHQAASASGIMVRVLSQAGWEGRYAGYRLYLDGEPVRSGALTSDPVAVPFTGPGQPTITAELIDDHGQVSPRHSYALSAVEQLAPTAPQLPTPTSNADGSVTLTWQPVPGAATYRIDLDGQEVATVSEPTWTLTSSGPRVATVRIRAVDARGATSLPSSPLVVTTT